MPVTNYYTIDGQMIGYKDASGRKDYLTDALGSVTAEVDQTGATKTFDGRYKPYGGDLSSNGTRGSYGWVGGWGYRGTGLSASSHYVRARHYSKSSGMWTTKDRIWPIESAFGYSDSNPVFRADPSGLKPERMKTPKLPVFDPCGGQSSDDAVRSPCRNILPGYEDLRKAIEECLKKGEDPKDLGNCLKGKGKDFKKELSLEMIQYLVCMGIGERMGNPGINACGPPMPKDSDSRQWCCEGWKLVCQLICFVNFFDDPIAYMACLGKCETGFNICWDATG